MSEFVVVFVIIALAAAGYIGWRLWPASSDEEPRHRR